MRKSMNKRYITNKELEAGCLEFVRQMHEDNWRPDYIVGVTRGGLQLAVMLSHFTNTLMHTLDVRLRDGSGTGPESNLWMSEDAFGYVEIKDRDDVWRISKSDPGKRKNILIVDDINDTGETFNWIKDDWQKSCMPNDEAWNDVWHNNVKFAVLIDNIPSKADVDYSSIEINKDEDPAWIVFPYEEWWRAN